ncbi:MAG: helix-turn-helix transcriptional regulator [Clostridia bacterium]|nr:helix-turn-helix transcriptional regulator [Clostridia bacterium]
MKLKQHSDCNFEKCIAYINDNFCNPDLKIPDICRIGHISEATLRRKFLMYREMSPKQYLMKLRMNKALTLLVKGEYSVKEISRISGFNDEKYFSRIFKKTYSLPPSSFY